MNDPIKITVSDPMTGEELESRTITDDFMVICAGNRYLDGVQAHANGTQVLTVKRRPAEGTGQPTNHEIRAREGQQ